MINIVLVEPEIPQNTGNIARTCACTGTKLHLVAPLGFDVSEKAVRRAGLDYWDKLDITYHNSLDEFMAKNAGKTMFFCSTKAKKLYTEPNYYQPKIKEKDTNKENCSHSNNTEVYLNNIEDSHSNDTNDIYLNNIEGSHSNDTNDIYLNNIEDIYFLFGKETKGLPESLIYDNLDSAIKIPMSKNIRSLNLSNAVSIILFEALRQQNFKGLS